MSASEHRARAPEQVAVALITVSDSRTLETDKSGQYLEHMLTTAGHHVSGRHVVPDERDALHAALVSAAAPAQVIITSGGTGIAGRDITIPLIEQLLTKPLPGFGELFRMLSYEEVGAAAMLSRATAGLARIQHEGTEHTVLLFALPGSTNAVKTAWTKLLADELPHLVLEMTK